MSFEAKTFLSQVTQEHGVYRMFDEKGQILYVGKAKNLKKRLSSYFRLHHTSQKTSALVAQINHIEVTLTHTENEALILEQHLIKELKPRYNVLLRDDKSYPYLWISDDPYPRITLHRGSKKRSGRYLGPYPSATSVRETLHFMQGVFKLRDCENSVFAHRSRPCLNYQIKRCSAPCVGYITQEAYQQTLKDAALFLEGKEETLTEQLSSRMQEASARLNYEEAALCRDQIASIRHLQERQYVSGEKGDLDIIAVAIQYGIVCIEIFYVRKGRNLGNKAFFPKVPADISPEEVVNAFVSYYYFQHDPPAMLLVSHVPEEIDWLQKGLEAKTQRSIVIRKPRRGEHVRWLNMALHNARQAIQQRQGQTASLQERWQSLTKRLPECHSLERIECFDVSHTFGEATVAACVVFTQEGPLKSAYRRFNLSPAQGGDDYDAMYQALTRHYSKLQENESPLPQLLLVDGGEGQLKMACRVMAELDIHTITLLGVAKGPERKPGLERLILAQGEAIVLAPEDPAFHLIQWIRDEAHRFAIAGHRKQRDGARKKSVLESIPGVGTKRRRELLNYFGGLREVARAGVEDLCRVPGISPQLAADIYGCFHCSGQ